MYKYVIGYDPAGNHHKVKGEGDGTSGYCVFDIDRDKVIEVAEVCSKDYNTWQEYFKANWKQLAGYLEQYPDSCVSVEDYILYSSKASAQSWSHVPTARLLGYILMKLHAGKVDYYIRPAVDVKNRWSNDILIRRNYILGVDNSSSTEHCHARTKLYIEVGDERVYLLSHHLDSIRHAVHCAHLEITKDRGNKNG